MYITVNRKSKVPLSDQICHSIMERIRSGLLDDGETLPSVRELSSRIHVSVLTVLNAYKKLEGLGFAVRKHGKGTFVSHGQNNRTNSMASRFDWQSSIHDYTGRSLFGQQTKRLQSEIRYPFHLATLSQDEFLPIVPIQKAIEAASKDVSSISGYVSPSGDVSLRKTLSDYLLQLGCTVSSSELMVTTGCQQGLDLVARTFVGPGDLVAVESPTYPAALDVFRSRGATIVPIPADHNGIRLDLLTTLFDQRPPKVLYVIPTGQNPTGRVMDVRTRKNLLDLAESFHSLIVEDEPWGELYYEDNQPRSIFSMDTAGHVIYLKGFSKTVTPGLRIGSLAARGSVYQRLVNVKALADLCTPLFNQRSFHYLLETYSLRDHYKRLRTALKERRDRADRLLNSCASAAMEWETPQAGPTFWIRSKTDTDLLLMEAEKENLSFLPGSVCFNGTPANSYLRLGFASLPSELMDEGIRTLCRLLPDRPF